MENAKTKALLLQSLHSSIPSGNIEDFSEEQAFTLIRAKTGNFMTFLVLS
jgi:hypothetical protein